MTRGGRMPINRVVLGFMLLFAPALAWGQSSSGGWLSLSGGTLTGNVTINNGTGGTELTVTHSASIGGALTVTGSAALGGISISKAITGAGTGTLVSNLMQITSDTRSIAGGSLFGFEFLHNAGGSLMQGDRVASASRFVLTAAPAVGENPFLVGFEQTASSAVNAGGVATTTTNSVAPGVTAIPVASSTGMVIGDQVWVNGSAGPEAATIATIPDGTDITIAVGFAGSLTNGAAVYDPKGQMQGGLAQVNLTGTATNFRSAVAFAPALNLTTGNSPLLRAYINIASAVTTDAVAGTLYDMGMGFSNIAGGQRMQNGILFHPFNGDNPVTTSGTLFATAGAATVANGLNISSYTYSGNSWNDGHFQMTGAGELIGSKITDPNTAPGAGKLKLTMEAGTNAGTCKLVARAGTSATAVTVVDNVGTGC